MRICLVNDYSLTHIGGAVISLLEQKRALEAAGHTVFILQLGKTQAVEGIKPADIIFIKPTFTLGEAFYSLPFILGSKKNLVKISTVLREAKVDIIHFQSEYSLAFAASRVAEQLKIPTVYTIHTFFWKYPSNFALKPTAAIIKFFFSKFTGQKIITEELKGNQVEQTLKSITLALAKRSDAVISPSSHQKKVLEQTSLKTPVYVLPNPYRAPAGTLQPQLLKVNQNLRIAWIGRCVPEKRLLEFLEAVKIAQAKNGTGEKNLPILVDVIGDGSLLTEAEARFSSDSITFHGKQPHAKIVEYIDNSSLVALSSYHFDNQPMTIAESISRFRGVLYCDEQLTEGLENAGYKSNNESVEAMAEAIVKLSEDPQLAVDLSKKAQADSPIFSAETYTKNAEEIYSQLLNR